MKYMITLVILIYIDIEMMYWVAWQLGLAERIACVVLMLIHIILFFGICYYQLKRRQTNDTEKESSHL